MTERQYSPGEVVAVRVEIDAGPNDGGMMLVQGGSVPQIGVHEDQCAPWTSRAERAALDAVVDRINRWCPKEAMDVHVPPYEAWEMLIATRFALRQVVDALDAIREGEENG